MQMVPTRDGFGKGLVEAGEKDQRVVALCADLSESTRFHWFAQKFPERFIQMGVAEQNLATVASGMANYGKIPFIGSYAAFSPGRNNEQIRTTISLNNIPVKVIGCHAGVSVGPDGATHQQIEDIALMRVQPNMTVVVPCDAVEAQKATVAIAFNNKPSYLRLGREKSWVFTTPDTPFEVGKAEILRVSSASSGQADVVIIGCGILLYNALAAAEELAKEQIDCMVINSHTVKPLDEKTIIEVAKKCGAVVSVEEHQVNGGLGSAIAECLAKNHPVPQEFIGVQDRFGESGDPFELIEVLGMGVGSIKEAVKKVFKRKNK
ncbi:MAG: transketolase [Candidatus Yanofskybacteria bacterium RIFCSPHIGHO2_02_FULL_41_29]|uniref:Transketolase n=1 Tax=Candidatus Yanofskybacteria bacterium RIFCSPHIGHO2_01_FULL_41_53 TaxID=1802663 RepID=A0A1F8EGR4_9BACT|nr:MAG: transketolase [Candidatus Yanofskybacteria bacterium RIFCSPHIGHO2_01_FULL_41_53]OGN11130.1 MAG: transketolase [Candidatus Yanofskybacteria bacterium RIFCSPHIGHO2_02_FULL_41_29]OGN17004.1 MAG: transketolase [Candidatus Yanofskybacteria bacterium RIFCSPHIGHO2_12_FULL_41_9]OGN22056.1 MAG: transketolase [Candidatus Yanofskybacteria bacterium RIFCSPLOWO2_01_FULL_41_67]OGN29341.1 MAG: transketolase [Candidatus Yanofskybacteria bacterium RIFCSPLOWO2_02_FULL_41_13]OGN33413.1 MAG: transketolase